MGYCTKTSIERIIAQAQLTAPNAGDEPVDLIRLGNTLDENNVPEDVVNQYILWADEMINSVLNQLYNTPICEAADFEAPLFANIDDYNSYIVLEGVCPINIGDTVILTDGTHTERHIIDQILDTIDKNVFQTLESINYNFRANSTRVVRVKYPDPLTLISSMLAASRIYDRFFSSQSDENASQFGQNLRSQARAMLNNILNGRTILHGVHRIGGTGFYNPNLDRQYGLVKGSEGAKDMDELVRG